MNQNSVVQTDAWLDALSHIIGKCVSEKDYMDELAIDTKGKKNYKEILLYSSQVYYQSIREQNNVEDYDNLWGKYISLKNFQFDKILDDMTGGMNLGDNIPPSYRKFYTDQRIYTKNGERFHRGMSYFTNSNPRLSKLEKLMFLRKDLTDALRLLDDLPRESHGDGFVAYIGVLDYIKSHLTTLLHAFTFKERFLDFQILNEDYQVIRSRLISETTFFTRMYYQTLLGIDYDVRNFSSEDVLLKIARVIDYINESSLNSDSLKQSELDNPRIILQASNEFHKNLPETQTIVGLPSGGTELAIVTGLIFELKTGRQMNVLLIPISRYSSQKCGATNLHSNYSSYLEQYKNQLQDRKVLIVDDNSNTGLTAQLATKEINNFQPQSIDFQVAEIDIYRSIVKNTQWNEPPQTISNPMVFRSSSNIVPIIYNSKFLKDFKQIRKLRRLEVIKDYYFRILKKNDVIFNLQSTKPRQNIKICGVHNTCDLLTCMNNGVHWIGIHLTYNQSEYLDKLQKCNSEYPYIDTFIKNEYHVNSDLPIPWAEYASIKDMLYLIAHKKLDVNPVLLISTTNIDNILSIINLLVPNIQKEPLYLQIQSVYDKKFIATLRDRLKKKCKFTISVIQSIGANIKNFDSVATSADIDSNVDYLLFDYAQKGGTGKQINIRSVQSTLQHIDKPFFIAGGISSSNINKIYSRLKNNSIHTFGLDLESSVEYYKGKFFKIDSYRSNNLICCKLRKDPVKVREFINQTVSLHQFLI